MKDSCLLCHAELPLQDDNEHPLMQRICADCSESLLAPQPAVSLAEFLEQLDAPVLLMDDDVRVAGFNESARALLGCAPHDLTGKLPCDVINCEFARLPGGCGRTEHCPACAIRNAVTATHQTGKSHRNVLAKPQGVAISTEKMGRFVLLRIDEA